MKNQKTTKRALLMSALALLLCVSMLVGSTYAWFTDSVTSAGNIIKSGTLEVEMYWADGKEAPASATWTDASKGAIFNNDLWEPGYVEAKHIKIANVGSLALSYQLRLVANGTISKLGDVIDVYCFDNATQLTRETVSQGTKLGTLTEMFGAQKNLSKAVRGDLLEGEEKLVTIAFKMQESAGNEYQGLSIGSDFSVELTAIQHTYEKDSFSSTYDQNALSDAVPAAFVQELENKNISATMGIGGAADLIELDTAYQFQPSQSFDELMGSEYKYYMADFIVSADKDVPEGSIVLAGYYHAWCDAINDGNWFALKNDGLPVKAGDEIALLEGMGYPVHYKDILQFGNDGTGFLCGAADLTGANAGTTITVKLCLFETTADPNGSSASDVKVPGVDPIVIGEFKYTFPPVKAANQDELNKAIADGAAEIAVSAGTYKFPSSSLKEGTTLICEEGTVFEGNSKANINGATVIGATFSNPSGTAVDQTINGTFKDCVFDGSNGLRWCYAGETVVFENCVFTGDVYGAHFDGGANDALFKNCTFSGFNAFGGAITKLTLDGCTFVSNGRSGYNGVNLWGSTDLLNCTFVFDGSVSYEWVDACGSNTTITAEGCKISDGTTTRALVVGDIGDYGSGNTIVVK
ncbi:MAG: right-handed parallel beta-helix repeat-containing protein [Clostridia bacterium]|nr:right-handed parallel beta-helix repeat-containing protein [Clostridia bacterium]